MSSKQGFFDSLNNIVLDKCLIHRHLLLTIVFSDILTSSYPTFAPSHFVQRNVGSVYVAVIASGISSPDIPLEQKTRNRSGPYCRNGRTSADSGCPSCSGCLRLKCIRNGEDVRSVLSAGLGEAV